MPSGERCTSVNVQRRRAVARSLTANAVVQVYARHAYRSISAHVLSFQKHTVTSFCEGTQKPTAMLCTGRAVVSPRGILRAALMTDAAWSGVVASRVASTVRLCTVKVQLSTSANVADLRIVHDFIFCIGCDLVAGSVSPLLSRPPSADVSRIWLRGRHCLLEALEAHCTRCTGVNHCRRHAFGCQAVALQSKVHHVRVETLTSRAPQG
jgi:hypothetical protein